MSKNQMCIINIFTADGHKYMSRLSRRRNIYINERKKYITQKKKTAYEHTSTCSECESCHGSLGGARTDSTAYSVNWPEFILLNNSVISASACTHYY